MIEYVRYYDSQATACGCTMTPNERELACMDLGLSLWPASQRDRDAESVPSVVCARVRLAGGRAIVTCMMCAGLWMERTDGKRPDLMPAPESWAERLAS